MATELDKLHCKVLALYQESDLRAAHFAREDRPVEFTAEYRVRLMLGWILRLFAEAESHEHLFQDTCIKGA